MAVAQNWWEMFGNTTSASGPFAGGPLAGVREPGDEPGIAGGDSPAAGDNGDDDDDTTPAPEPEPEPEPEFEPEYQVFTIQDLIDAGVNIDDWFAQYAGIFNPNGDITDWSVYAGVPVAVGYIDENGQFVGDPFSGAYQAYKLRSMQPPGLTDITDSEAYLGLTGLLETIKNYKPGSEEEIAYLEKILGLEPGTYSSFMQGMNQQLAGGIGGMEGFTEQERSLYQRQIQNTINNLRADSQEMFAALAGSGRSIAAFDAMETISGQIGDYTIQAQLEYLTNESARKTLEFQALKDQRDLYLQSGVAAAEQYNTQVRAAWNQMFQGFATQISAIATENQQYMDQYNSYVEQMYKSLMSDIGLTAAAMDQSYELWAQANLPEEEEWWQELIDLLTELLGE